MNRFFRYSGNKLKYVPMINDNIKTDKNVYVEPFVGSGAILFNLEHKFDKYIVNDVDRNITRIYNTFKNINYANYAETTSFVFEKFGHFKTKDSSTAKENYYNFRNWFNENYWNTDSELEGIFLHILANSCINSFLRFGKNGMNQSFGDRCYLLEEDTFNNIREILDKTEIHNTDYRELLDVDGFFFFDPPYASQDSSYTSFSMDDLKEFIKNIRGKEFLYTDILNDVNNSLKHKMLIREMRSTSPNTDKQLNGNMEYLFSSYPLK